MNFVERALTFSCDGETLIGVVAEPLTPATVGAIVIVGGPQYRAGSHRQFVLLSRRLAGEGVAAMRFDYRGMGDSTGTPAPFDDASDDIASAIGAMQRSIPTIRRVVLFGLCDAAAAALMYWQATRDGRVGGLVLLNPWVRSEESIARVRVKNYYARRLLQMQFWRKLARGAVDVAGAMREVKADLATGRRAIGAPSPNDGMTFQDRMAAGMEAFDGPVLLILSGRDLTAKEFLEYTATNRRWSGLLKRALVFRHDVDDADHTFSSARLRERVETIASDWLRRWFPLV